MTEGLPVNYDLNHLLNRIEFLEDANSRNEDSLPALAQRIAAIEDAFVGICDLVTRNLFKKLF